MVEERRPSQAECRECNASLVLLPSEVFRDEDAAAKLDLGVIKDTETEEVVAHYALLRVDGSYVCPVCETRFE
jgi:hypothetical protein